MPFLQFTVHLKSNAVPALRTADSPLCPGTQIGHSCYDGYGGQSANNRGNVSSLASRFVCFAMHGFALRASFDVTCVRCSCTIRRRDG